MSALEHQMRKDVTRPRICLVHSAWLILRDSLSTKREASARNLYTEDAIHLLTTSKHSRNALLLVCVRPCNRSVSRSNRIKLMFFASFSQIPSAKCRFTCQK
ncbi:unnamed protein product [Cylicocyclus nassatus]|uniref:Uncharacterized protein n=1 Tax=Cylicocyclus nassatus TaxID=53992 RepID=A0AA36DJX2_CYLNA|nr:unnamed protein product [Cylicocyclus nassatus]